MFHFAGQHKAFLWVCCKLILLNWFFQHLFTTNSASHSFLLICSLTLLRQTLFVLIVYVNFYFTFKRFHNVLQCRLYGHSAKATCFNKKKTKTRTSSLVLVSMSYCARQLSHLALPWYNSKHPEHTAGQFTGNHIPFSLLFQLEVPFDGMFVYASSAYAVHGSQSLQKETM